MALFIPIISRSAGDVMDMPSVIINGGSGESGQNPCDDRAGMVPARKIIENQIEGRRATEERRRGFSSPGKIPVF
jgi:hypothetical protein